MQSITRESYIILRGWFEVVFLLVLGTTFSAVEPNGETRVPVFTVRGSKLWAFITNKFTGQFGLKIVFCLDSWDGRCSDFELVFVN